MEGLFGDEANECYQFFHHATRQHVPGKCYVLYSPHVLLGLPLNYPSCRKQVPPKATVITEDELAEMKRRAIITSLADEVAAREAKEKILEVGLVSEGLGVCVATGMYLLVVVYHLAISLDTNTVRSFCI